MRRNIVICPVIVCVAILAACREPKQGVSIPSESNAAKTNPSNQGDVDWRIRAKSTPLPLFDSKKFAPLLDPEFVHNDISLIRELLDPIASGGSGAESSIKFIEANAAKLAESRALDNFESVRKALENPRVAAVIFDQYRIYRSNGIFWLVGALELGETGNRSFARDLLSEYLAKPSFDYSMYPGWGLVHAEASSPKCVLADVLFQLDDGKSLDELWSRFPSAKENDQLVVARAASSSRSYYQVRKILDLIDRAKSDQVRAELRDSANRILSFRISNTPEDQRAGEVEVIAPLIQELKKRNLARDFLLSEIPPSGK